MALVFQPVPQLKFSQKNKLEAYMGAAWGKLLLISCWKGAMNSRRGDSGGPQEPLLESLVATDEESNARKGKSSIFPAGKRKEWIFMQ